MIEFYEFQSQLAKLARRADRENMSRQGILDSIVSIANRYHDKAEEMELQMIVEAQMDPSNSRYDFGLTESV